jgi:hypothetical protein
MRELLTRLENSPWLPSCNRPNWAAIKDAGQQALNHDDAAAYRGMRRAPRSSLPSPAAFSLSFRRSMHVKLPAMV